MIILSKLFIAISDITTDVNSIGMQNMPNLGGSGASPPEILKNYTPLRLNLRAFLMIYNPLATLYYLITLACIYKLLFCEWH